MHGNEHRSPNIQKLLGDRSHAGVSHAGQASRTPRPAQCSTCVHRERCDFSGVRRMCWQHAGSRRNRGPGGLQPHDTVTGAWLHALSFIASIGASGNGDPCCARRSGMRAVATFAAAWPSPKRSACMSINKDVANGNCVHHVLIVVFAVFSASHSLNSTRFLRRAAQLAQKTLSIEAHTRHTEETARFDVLRDDHLVPAPSFLSTGAATALPPWPRPRGCDFKSSPLLT